MIRQFMEDAHKHLSGIPNPTPEEKELLIQLNLCYDMFPITSVTREDLEGKGFIIEKTDNDKMKGLANKMRDNYRGILFWDYMIIFAEEMGFPRKTCCPKCSEFKNIGDTGGGNFICNKCGKEWFEETDPADKIETDDRKQNDDWDAIAEEIELARRIHCTRCKEYKNIRNEGNGRHVCGVCENVWIEEQLAEL